MPWLRYLDYERLNDSLAGIQASLTNLHSHFHTLDRKVDTMAKAIDDLNAAVSDITTAVNDYATAVAAEISAIQAANQSGSQDADIEAAVTNLKSLTDTLKADTAAAQPPTT